MAGKALMAQGLERRQAIYEFCKTFIKNNGYGPSIEEITVAVGLQSKTGVRHHLDNLIAQGVIVMTPGKYRSLRIPDGRKRVT